MIGMEAYLRLLLLASILLNLGLGIETLHLRRQFRRLRGSDLTPEEMNFLKGRLLRIKRLTEGSENSTP